MPDIENETAATVLAEYMEEDELASELKISPRTLKRWRALREAPPVTRVGKKVLFHRPAVKKWLAARQVDAS